MARGGITRIYMSLGEGPSNPQCPDSSFSRDLDCRVVCGSEKTKAKLTASRWTKTALPCPEFTVSDGPGVGMAPLFWPYGVRLVRSESACCAELNGVDITGK